MTLQIYLVGGLNGGAGRSLTAALLAYGLHLQGRPTMLVEQKDDGIVSEIEPLAATLPLPCCQLALPAPYVLPGDLGVGMRMMIGNADTRFMDALLRLALAEVGEDADVVVDLCSNDRALNAAAMREAALVLFPARPSVFELDWAVRSFASARGVQRHREFVTPALFAPIAPDEQRTSQRDLLSSLMRDCDPDRELVPGDPLQIMIDVPFLSPGLLIELFDERPIWQDPDLAAHCRAFAAAALTRADAFMTMMEEANDEL